MSAPLPLPEPIKRVARRARAMPTINRPVTRTVKTLLPFLPAAVGRWLQDHFPRVGRVAAPLPGGGRLIMSSREPEFFLNQIYYGDWTAGEADILLWRRMAEHADLVLDIGAHIGHFALVAGEANPRARVLAFEPLPRIAAALRANVRAMRLANVSVTEAALSDIAGTATFFAVPDGMPSSSSLSKTFMEHGNHTLAPTEVKTDTLDNLALDTDGVTLMKIDTETTEDDVIRGGAGFLTRIKPVIVIEVLDTVEADRRIEAAIGELDVRYDFYLLTDAGPVKRDRLQAHPHWRNYLLMPRSGRSAEALGALL